jgi:hypothetical protein
MKINKKGSNGTLYSCLKIIINACLLAFILIFLVSIVPDTASASSTDKALTGPPQAEAEKKQDQAPKISRPSVIYVTDFYLDPTQVKKETVLHSEGMVKKRLESLKGDDDPSEKAAKLVTTLSNSIIKELQSAGFKAEYLHNPEGLRKDFMPKGLNLPKEGWLVAGWFSKVDEGNRAVSSTVGFGRGEESVEIDAVVYDLLKDASEPFLCMGSESAASKTPGGLITKNPYTMAAKYVLSKGATEKDVQKQGSEIAKTLLQYIKDQTVN